MPQIIKITDLQAPDLAVYTHLNESQLKHYFEPYPDGIFIAESPNAIERAMDAGYQPLSILMEEKYLDTQGRTILEKCREAEDSRKAGHEICPIPVYVSTIDVLSKLTGYHLTRGILSAFRRKRPESVESICRNARRIAILDNIENPTNIGAIFRSAAALGMDAVLVTPSCADPLQRRSIRVSVGTVFQIPWTYIGVAETPAHRNALRIRTFNPDGSPEHDSSISDSVLKGACDFAAKNNQQPLQEDLWPDQEMQKLRVLGFYIVAMALRHDTLAIDDPALSRKERLAVILGNEGSGLPEHTISLCDATVKIPMSHGVDSLNVAAASAVMFYCISQLHATV